MGTAMPAAVPSFIHLPEIFFTEPFEAKVLTVFTDISKPKLTASEARNRSTLIEEMKRLQPKEVI